MLLLGVGGHHIGWHRKRHWFTPQPHRLLQVNFCRARIMQLYAYFEYNVPYIRLLISAI